MPRLLHRFLLACTLLALLGGVARGDEEDTSELSDALRKKQIKRLKSQIRKKARSPRAVHYGDDVLTLIESLEVLGGHEAAAAALEALPLEDETVRDRVFTLVETERHEELVKPVLFLLEAKEYRRDVDLRSRVARTLSVLADSRAVEPLSDLVRTDEDAKVVAVAADSLATFTAAALPLRKIAVKQLVDTYTSTHNLMTSIRPEDKIERARMSKRYKVYGRAVRAALQALTGQQISRPHEWRQWWNGNKKRRDW